MGDRRKRVKPETVLAHCIPLPSIQERRQLVAKLDRVAALAEKARRVLDEARLDMAALLAQTERKVWPDDAIAAGEPLDAVTTFLSRGRQSKQGDSDHFLIKSQHVQMGFCRPTKRIGVPAPHHGGGPGRGEARDQGDVAVEVLRR